MFLSHSFAGGAEAFVTALPTSLLHWGSADWFWLDRDPGTPFEAVSDLAAALQVGEVAPVGGGIDVTSAWAVRVAAAAAPTVMVFEGKEAAEAFAAANRQRGAA